MDIGQTITDLRNDRDYTQKQMAKMLNISASCLSKYEKNATQPPLDMLVEICDALNVSADYLLGRNDFLFDYKKLNLPYHKSQSCFAVLNDMLELSRENRARLLDYLILLKSDTLLSKLKSQR